VDLQLEVRDQDKTEILKATPNPWITETEIEFHMAADGQGVWEFYDLHGKLLLKTKSFYQQGLQSIIVNKDQIDANGVVYLKLITDDSISEYKMIVVE